jgi:hypothetical protein
MASPIKDTAWLEWMASLMGVGSRQALTAALAPGRFHCLLDELPLHLIPLQLEDKNVCPQELFLNPDCTVLAPGHVPAELESHPDLLENFNLERTIAWVCDPATGSLDPFWLGPRLEAALSLLGSGDAPSVQLPSDVRTVLADANILVPSNHKERRLAQWQEIVGQGSRSFREKGYAPLRKLIHPFLIAALRRYYRQAIRRGTIRLGDDQSARRYVAHNESVARFFHHQIANVVRTIAGEAIKPSYVYFASYLGGAELKKHTDREQCEFSVTLCLDFSPEPELATPWPIRLDSGKSSVAVYQALGDGLVYRGTQVPHHRNALPAGCTSTSIFFHYVPADFSGPLN